MEYLHRVAHEAVICAHDSFVAHEAVICAHDSFLGHVKNKETTPERWDQLGMQPRVSILLLLLPNGVLV